MVTIRPFPTGSPLIRGPFTTDRRTMSLPRSTAVRLAAGAAIATLTLAGCADGDGGATPSPSVTSTLPTPEETATTTAPEPSTEPTASDSAPPPPSTPADTPSDKPTKVKITIVGTDVTTASDTVTAAPGDVLRLVVVTDAPDELHVHGVEQTLQLEAGVKNKVDVVIPADLVPGLYEVETHESALLLFMLQVS